MPGVSHHRRGNFRLIEDEYDRILIEVIEPTALHIMPRLIELSLFIVVGIDFPARLQETASLIIEHGRDNVGLVDRGGRAIVKNAGFLDLGAVGKREASSDALPIGDFLVFGEGNEIIVEGIGAEVGFATIREGGEANEMLEILRCVASLASLVEDGCIGLEEVLIVEDATDRVF